MIKLFEQWLAEETGEFTITASTDKGDVDFDGTKQDDLSSPMTTADLAISSRTPLVEEGDLVMISQKDKEMGNKSDIVISKNPSDLTDAVQLIAIVEITAKQAKSEEDSLKVDSSVL